MFDYIGLLFENVWGLYQIPFPGFNFSIGSVVIGSLVVVISLKFLGRVTGMSFNGSGIIKTISKGGNNKNIKVSADRKGDER